MRLGRRKLLAVFLEGDNLKLLVYDVLGSRSTRSFAGQISFSAEVVKDAYVADPAKFAGQVKMAISAKEPLSQTAEVVLFLPASKTFTKSLPASDAVDSFVQSLPYFAEELILSTEGSGVRGLGSGRVTHVAFEKKLVEDLERPFLESGKKVLAVKSSVNVLALAYGQVGKYFLLIPFEKEIFVAVVEDGAVAEVAAFAKDVFASRFGEFILNRNLESVRQAYTVGVFDADLANKIRAERGMEVVSVVAGDVYDGAVGAYLRAAGGGLLGNVLGMVDFSAVSRRLPNRRFLLLAGAGLVGAILVVMLVRGIGGGRPGEENPPAGGPAATAPPPAPEPKPEEFKVRVLNGTLVEGEAGRLSTKLKDLGFEVVETRNATTAGFVATRLRTTANVPAKIADMVKAALVDTYESITPELLASDSAGVKIEVILGKKK